MRERDAGDLPESQTGVPAALAGWCCRGGLPDPSDLRALPAPLGLAAVTLAQVCVRPAGDAGGATRAADQAPTIPQCTAFHSLKALGSFM